MRRCVARPFCEANPNYEGILNPFIANGLREAPDLFPSEGWQVCNGLLASARFFERVKVTVFRLVELRTEIGAEAGI